MNFFAWLQFVQALATAYATSQGKDLRALAYLRLVTTVITGQHATDAELQALMEEYGAKVGGQVPTTVEELQELDARLASRSAAIQSA
jgi:hypothetical protein